MWPKRKKSARVYLVLLIVIMFGPMLLPHALGQTKAARAGKSPLCTRANALDLINQQAGLTRTFNDGVRRITVLIRAADLLWPYEQKKSRAIFTEAFELAAENEKEVEQKASRVILLRMQFPDQRYIVIRAVAKRDAGWAKELMRQMLKPGREAAATRDSFADLLTGSRLLDSAQKLISEDLNSALDLARTSLNYPANFMLTHFLYKLAGVNQQEADRFYAQALTVYGERPMREFLYLQAYPFAWRETLNTPVFSFDQNIPANYVPNKSLQRRFVQAILRRAQQSLELQLDPNDRYQDPSQGRLPGTARILEGLIKLEPQVRTSLPDLLPALTEAREKILVSLSVENQKRFLQPGQEVSIKPQQSFDELIEAAQKTPDVDERDEMIVTAIMGADNESLERVVPTIDQISDSNLRERLLEWFYFQRAGAAVQQNEFDKAEKLTARVEGTEIRAYLHTEIAKGLLRSSATQTHAQEVLDEAINEAKKVGTTIFAARTLLTASNLYAKIDLNRSISVLADAINFINRIEAPDFVSDDQTHEKTLQRTFRFYMPGLDPERAFRELAKLDFDTALSQSSALTDKFQRALATMSMAEVCLSRK